MYLNLLALALGGGCPLLPRPGEAAVWEPASSLQRLLGYNEGVQISKVTAPCLLCFRRALWVGFVSDVFFKVSVDITRGLRLLLAFGLPSFNRAHPGHIWPLVAVCLPAELWCLEELFDYASLS